MVTAIVVSGGNGSRTGQAVPKQYLTVNDIPVIAYTLMNLQKVSEIDKIIVVAAEGWENFIYAYAAQFGVSKLSNVVIGGVTRNESIYNGLRSLKNDGETQIVCIVDANRPMIPRAVFTENIALLNDCDIAMAAEPCYDSMFFSEEGECADAHIERSKLFRGLTPESARLDTLLEIYEEESARLDTKLSTSGLGIAKGKSVRLSKGSIKCFKITTVDDFELFKAYLAADKIQNLI
ncbi:MAG: 2-C-methyl-D-erythritol 4-phosphate cytidylyltransferase [Ruminococcaceae bacterium]|nr:2-C-methyl-D-erythritol 4-phosphate cytidylyltransferase [Oscillospiraceae bacterium]